MENNNKNTEIDGVQQEATYYASIKDVLNAAQHNDLICKRVLDFYDIYLIKILFSGIELYLARKFRYQSKFNSFGIAVARDKYHTINLMVTGYFENPEDKPPQYEPGDKLQIVANVIVEESGWVSLNGAYNKIKKVDEDVSIYKALTRATYPGKVSVIVLGNMKKGF